MGLWLAISPWVLNYGADDATVLAVVLGVVAALLAIIRIAEGPGADWLAWVSAAVGLSLLPLAFLAPDTRRGLWSFLVAGVLVFVTSLWSASPRSAGREQRRPL